MSSIYQPSGKAREYSPLAVNLFHGCSHGCEYCYARTISKKGQEQWRTEVTPTRDTLQSIARDAKKYDGSQNVLLCFLTDPYQPEIYERGITRDAIQILNDNGLPVTILTKGGRRACRDFDLLRQNPRNEFAITLTGLSDAESATWEPGAASPTDRIASLKIAKVQEIKTWVSFEPVINPAGVLATIPELIWCVDLFKVGKLNYHKLAATIDWFQFRQDVEAVLERYGAKYLLKADLLKAKPQSGQAPGFQGENIKSSEVKIA